MISAAKEIYVSSEKSVLNIPNKLSLLRIILSPLILLFMLPIPCNCEWLQGWNQFVTNWGMIIAAILFGFASYTDYLDGHIARSTNQVSTFGKFIDPIGDKLLVMTVFTAWVELGRVTSFVPIIILLREFSVTGLRLIAAGKGQVIAASYFGKCKTVSQIIALSFLYVEYFFKHFNVLQTIQPWFQLR